MIYLFIIIPVLVIMMAGIRIVRPTQCGLPERLGRYNILALPGFHWIIPIVDRFYLVNVREKMVDADPQDIITNDDLNASVDAQVNFRVKSDETADKYFIGNAQLMRELEALEKNWRRVQKK